MVQHREQCFEDPSFAVLHCAVQCSHGKTVNESPRNSSPDTLITPEYAPYLCIHHPGSCLPLFAFLRANPGYILTNDITPGILYALTAVLCIVLPSSIALFMLAIRFMNKRLYWILQRVLVSLLAMLSLLPLLGRMDINQMEIVPAWQASSLEPCSQESLSMNTPPTSSHAWPSHSWRRSP